MKIMKAIWVTLGIVIGQVLKLPYLISMKLLGSSKIARFWQPRYTAVARYFDVAPPVLESVYSSISTEWAAFIFVRVDEPLCEQELFVDYKWLSRRATVI
jgi:hypothetical protein